MSKTYKIKNWHDFQHYKDRRPPWIKLHRQLLDDPDYFALPDKTAKHLPLLWLMASETEDGSLPNIKAMAFRLRISVSDCQKIIDGLLHYLTCSEHDASTMLADCLQLAVPETEKSREEREREADIALQTSRSESGNKRRVVKMADDKTWLEEIRAIYRPLGVDVDTQLAKAKAWLLSPRGKGRKFTQQFFVNWLSKADTTIIHEIDRQSTDNERINREFIERTNRLMMEGD